MKDLRVLVVGCGGTGVETAKNLILSNVGAVTLWDPAPCVAADRGSNFYVTDDHVSAGNVGRAAASVGELRSLNPYCRVDVLEGVAAADLAAAVRGAPDDDDGNRRPPYAAVAVTTWLPRDALLALNEAARSCGVAFVLAVTTGVTCSLFSDFGPRHEISDATGEPTQTLAVSAVEVLDAKAPLLRVAGVADGAKVVIVTVAQHDHGLEDGDVVVLEDMRDGMEGLNGRSVTVRRVAITSPVRAAVALELSPRDLTLYTGARMCLAVRGS